MSKYTHPIPLKVLDQHIVFLGKTGAGKSSAMRSIYEQLLNLDRRVCIVDPKGDHYGIKLDASGKKAGYPVMAFGNFKNERASDLAIDEHAGREIGELVATGNRPCVIGMRGWRHSQMHTFWVDFAETLFGMNNAPVHLFVDEVHNFDPKGKVFSPLAGESIFWSNRLGSEGRGVGIRLALGSQRPQKVHNDLLTSCETLVAMRVTHSSDRAAYQEWLEEYSTDNSKEREILKSLSSMKRGEAIVWSPEVDFHKHLEFPRFLTFDSFAPPSAGKQLVLKGWANIDLAEVQEKIAKTKERADANNPKKLQEQVVALKKELEKVLQKKEKAPTKVEVTKLDEKALKREVNKATSPLRKQLEAAMKFIVEITTRNFDSSIPQEQVKAAIDAAVAKALESAQSKMDMKGKEFEAMKNKANTLLRDMKALLEQDIEVKLEVKHNEPYTVIPTERKTLPAQSARVEYNGEKLGKCETAIASYLFSNPERQWSRTQVGIMVGYSPKSSGFENALSWLNARGIILRHGKALQAGAVKPDGLTTGATFSVDNIKGKLGKCELQIYEVLLDKSNQTLTREEVAERTASQYSPTSSGFENAISALSSLGALMRVGKNLRLSFDIKELL